MESVIKINGNSIEVQISGVPEALQAVAPCVLLYIVKKYVKDCKISEEVVWAVDKAMSEGEHTPFESAAES